MSNEIWVKVDKDDKIIGSPVYSDSEIVKELKQITKELKRHNEQMGWLEQAISQLTRSI